MPVPPPGSEAPAPLPRSGPTFANADVFPWPVLSVREAAWLAGVWAAVLAAISLAAHPTALYFVETDLVGEYLPAARELASGVLNTAHYGTKGPGYPMMVAIASWLCGGDVGVAARVLSPLAGGAAAFAAFLLARRAAGGVAATFAMGALLVTPVFVRHAIEAGTDLPALALMLASTHLVLRPGAWRGRLVAGLLAGVAVLTRSNALFLVPCALIALAAGRDRARALAAYAGGATAPMLAWLLAAHAAGGLPPDRNYLNVAWELYGRGLAWDQFQLTTGPRFHSLWDVFTYQPGVAAARVAGNLVGQRVADVREMLMPWMAVFALPGAVLLAMRREARGLLLHACACALVLAPVFYNPRFALYLLPLQLAACGLALQEFARVIRDALHTTPAPRLVPLTAAALVLVSAVVSARENTERLQAAPHEARLAGEALARLGARGDRIVARKPHVAWYGGLSFVPLPADRPLRELSGCSWPRSTWTWEWSPRAASGSKHWRRPQRTTRTRSACCARRACATATWTAPPRRASAPCSWSGPARGTGRSSARSARCSRASTRRATRSRAPWNWSPRIPRTSSCSAARSSPGGTTPRRGWRSTAACGWSRATRRCG